ncbi:MAG: Cell division protein ZapA [Firmicutes bacterium]|nr:Cell division protein ZapA [candidate division NPL-UPA2 bacterium]MBT9155452.1 Cell division protein ZapA [candidate division NPL-UPA2 bacterium]
MEPKETVKLDIYGQSLQLRSAAPAELLRLARAIDKRMREYAEQYERISVTQLAILAALSATREAAEAEREKVELVRRISVLEQRLALIDQSETSQSRH